MLDGDQLHVRAGEIVGVWGLLGVGPDRIAAGAGRAGSDRRAALSAGASRRKLLPISPRQSAAKGRLRHRGSARRRAIPAALGRRQHRPAQPWAPSLRLGFIIRREQKRIADEMIRRLGIKVSGRRSAGGDAFGRQPAKGGVRPLARHRAQTVPAGRADARPRCRRQDRDPEAGQRTRGCRHGGAAGLVGNRGADPRLRPLPRDGARPHHRRAARLGEPERTAGCGLRGPERQAAA